MGPTLLEGIRAVWQPCSAPLLVGAFAVVLAAGRDAPLAVGTWMVVTGAVAWGRFAELWAFELSGASALLGGVSVMVGGAAVAMSRGNRVLNVAGTATVAIVVTFAWRPCVGLHLGAIVTSAPSDRLGTLVPSLVYMTGLSLVPLAVSLAPTAVPRLRSPMSTSVTRLTGTTFALMLGALMALGRWNAVVNELLERSGA